MVDELIAEAKKLLVKAEADVKDLVERVDPTQLRVAVHRLGLFVEHIGQVQADEPLDQPESEGDRDAEDLNALTRDELNERAETAGVYAPEKLPNKGAVIDAILEHVGLVGDEPEE